MKAEYQCQHCGYRFEAEKKPYTCPYCGDAGHVVPTPNAADLLDEVTKTEKRAE